MSDDVLREVVEALMTTTSTGSQIKRVRRLAKYVGPAPLGPDHRGRL